MTPFQGCLDSRWADTHRYLISLFQSYSNEFGYTRWATTYRLLITPFQGCLDFWRFSIGDYPLLTYFALSELFEGVRLYLMC